LRRNARQAHYRPSRQRKEARALRPATLAGAITVLVLTLGGCATPGELKRPLGAPTMARPAEINPLPAYAAPDSESHP
jgi:hypothetical protein